MEIISVAEIFMYRRKQNERVNLKYTTIVKIMDSLDINAESEKILSEHASEICERLADELNLNKEEKEKCKRVGKYHDIGKSIID